ncbi:hypothetical protein OEZ86_001256 [Tetradesmus obliquus]|nr:hypothetical protein OEZ86_001256 [Tetradesmus obliquus]
MKTLLMVLGLLLPHLLVPLQARTLHASWAGDADAAALLAALQATPDQRAAGSATEVRLAKLFVQHAAAFDYRGPAESAPAAYLAVSYEIQLKVTKVMLDKALALIIKWGKLSLVADIIGTYIATPNPLTGEQNNCGARLTTELEPVMKLLVEANYTAAVKQLVDKFVHAPEGPYKYLGTCAPDLAAVLLSLAGMTCPEAGYLVAPADVAVNASIPGPSGVSFGLKNVSCIYEAGKYEDTVGALLGGALMSELLLSKEAWLKGNGTALAFEMTRMAFTVLQSGSFPDCVANYVKYERKIPKTSFPLVSPAVRPDYYIGPLILNSTAESAATLCYATALLSFKPDTAAEAQPWEPSALVQVLVNVWLAMSREVRNATTSGLTQAQVDSLCDTLHHMLRFRGNPNRFSPIDMFDPAQYQCVLNPAIEPCPPEGVAPLAGVNGTRWFKRMPELAPGHDLGSELFPCKA